MLFWDFSDGALLDVSSKKDRRTVDPLMWADDCDDVGFIYVGF
jgi:hypothetical protein